MAFEADSLRKVAVYFGLAEDRDYYEDDEPDRAGARGELEDRYQRAPERPPPVARRRRDEIDDIFADDPRRAAHRQLRRSPRRGGNGRGRPPVHLVIPKRFNDAQDVADKFKDSIPVIINLQGSDPDLSKRLIDFASASRTRSTAASRIADKVFLLTPHNVEVSAEDAPRLIEKGFFNQS